MKRPGLLLFLIAFLLVIIGTLIYLKTNNPRISAHVKLVQLPAGRGSLEPGRDLL
ncbi:MAG: hypothetical protein ACM3X9_06065 [Bacillota bacterium]